MERRQFDRFADEYMALHARNIAVTGEPPEYFHEYKIRYLQKILDDKGYPSGNLRILDFGTGVGNSVPFFRKYFRDCELVCTDVSERSLEVARRRFGNCPSYVLFEGQTLPFRSKSFDLAFTACVFHHIPAVEHVGLLHEIHRVLVPGGHLFLYEHNPLNPLTVREVRTCEFDDDAILIRSSVMRERLRRAGYSRTSVRYCVFFPKFLRSLRILEPWLASVAIGAQYCVVGTVTDQG